MPRVALALAALASCVPAWGSVSVYMSPEDLARRSPVVVEARVLRTASGLDPQSGSLATYVTLRVEATHRGQLGETEIVIRESGGRYGTLVHDVDATPVYRPGERVLAFLEPRRDGTLRTTGMFFGKFTLTPASERVRWAHRQLAGQGLIFGGPAGDEWLPTNDLLAVVAAVPYHDRAAAHAGRPRTRPRPAELARLLWDDERTQGVTSLPGLGPAITTAEFVAVSPSNPARWFESDAGLPVKLEIQPTGNPLGDPAAAVAEVQRAMAAWNAVPESRLILDTGSVSYDFTGTRGTSPAASYSGINIVLFDDPYDDISDPVDCAGVLAIGGYWRTSALTGMINGVAFHSALQLYVIFNDGFECILADPDNLAEVAAHEIGHGIGFGHSDVNDSIMRATVYTNRGPRLGDDDRDAAHCHYPHRLTLLSPDGGEVWTSGSVHPILWTSTSESAPDPGTVTLEYSVDGGANWITLVEDVPNDGSHSWIVPELPGDATRVRVVRPNRSGTAPAPFPAACSLDVSDGPFSIVTPTLVAGEIPAGSDGLRVAREADGRLRLSWRPSCSADADDYAIYAGSLAALRDGAWDHQPLGCGVGGGLSAIISPAAGDRYFLVAPLAGSREGHFGRSSTGALRPASASACAPREAVPSCSSDSAAGLRALDDPMQLRLVERRRASERREPRRAPDAAPALP